MKRNILSKLAKLMVSTAAGALLAGLAQAQEDLAIYVVTQGQSLRQTGADTLVPESPTLPYFFYAFVQPISSNIVGGSVQSPKGTNYPLSVHEFDSDVNFEAEFGTLAEMNDPFGPGTYTFTLERAEGGACVLPLSFPAGPFPNDPRLANWLAAQSIDTRSNFTVRWDPLANGTASDFIMFALEDAMYGDTVFQTGQPGEPGALDGQATSVVIPANTLEPGATYWGRLLFANVVGLATNDCAGGIGLSAYHKETEFTIGTLNPYGILQFSLPAYAVGENDGMITIGVDRVGGAEGTVAVSFNVVGGEAQMDADYSLTFEPLVFGPGETNKTFAISILPDDLVESNEMIRLQLYNPSNGATLGNPDMAVVTIFESGLPEGPNVRSYIAAKGQSLIQTGVDAPIPDAEEGGSFHFFSAVDAAFPGGVTHASVRAPNGLSHTLRFEYDSFELFTGFTARVLLDNSFGGGSYTFMIDTLTEGIRMPTLSLPNDVPVPNPHVANWLDAQGVDADLPFTIWWDPFTNGTTADFIQVSIDNTDQEGGYSSGELLDEERLNGTNVSFTIPAGALAPESKYYARLLFVKRSSLNTNSYPGAIGISGHFRETRFPLCTLSPPPPGGRLQLDSRLYSVNESNGMAAITVVRSGGSQGSASVDFRTADGTATDGADYNGTNVTVTLADGETSKEILLPILDDALLEGTETVMLSLVNPSEGAALGGVSNAVLRILDNELASAGTLQFAVASNVVSEAGRVALVSVLRTGRTQGTVTVDFATMPGGTASDEDYVPTNGTLTFLSGQTSKAFAVPIINDALDEPTETVFLELRSPTGGATLGARSQTVLGILDNDRPGIINFKALRYSRSETSGVALITVTRTNGAAAGVSVDFATLDGTATNELDYTSLLTNVTFGSNQTVATLAVPILDDQLPEGNETVLLTLRNPAGGAILGVASNAVLTIVDNEVAIQFSRIAYGMREAARAALITLVRSGPTNRSAAVTVTSSDGTASSSSDYRAVSNVIAFAAGQVARSFVVAVTNDAVIEPDETVMLALSNPMGSGALLGPVSEATLTITNDDFPGVFNLALTNISVVETGRFATVRVVRTGGLASGTSVMLATMDDTATNGLDYTGLVTNLVFAAGEVEKRVKIPIIADTLLENTETFLVKLSEPSGGATLGPLSNAVVRVTNAPDRNAVPLSGDPFFRLTASPSMNTAFSRTFNVTPGGLQVLVGTYDPNANNRLTVTASISGISGLETCTIVIGGVTGPGRFAVGLGAPAAVVYSRAATGTGSFAWITGEANATGTVTIDGLQGTKASGRFDIIMVDDADSNKKIRAVGSFRTTLLVP